MKSIAILAVILAQAVWAAGGVDEARKLVKERRFDQAAKVLEQELSARPDDPAALGLMAAVQNERRNFKDAVELARRAHKLAPEDRDTSVVLAKSLLGIGKHKEATSILEGLIADRPKSASVRYGVANLLAQIGRRRDALSYLDDLVRSEPENGEYRKRRAQLLYELGGTEDAMDDWKRLAEQKPPDPDALMQLGWAYLGVKKLDEAAKTSKMLTSLDPENPNFIRLAASVAIERQDFKKAEELARRALKLAPGNRDNTLVLSKALIGQNKGEEAKQVLEGLAKDNPGNASVQYGMADLMARTGEGEASLKSLEELIKSDPDNTAYRRRRAQVLYEMGKVDDATAEWKFITENRPNDADSLMALGWVYLRSQKTEEARKVGQQLLSLEPRNAKFLRFMANVEIERQNYEDARKYAEDSLKLNPGDADATMALARALTQLRREREALVVLEGLVRRKIEDPRLWLQLAGLLAHFGRNEEALKYYDKVVKKDPDNVNLRRQRADSMYQAGFYKDAVEEWRTLARRNPPDTRSITRLADDAYYRKDHQEFISLIREAANLEPLTAYNWTRLAYAYAALGDYDRAMAAAERVIELNPATLEGYFTKAEMHEDKGEWTAAQKIWEYCLNRNPNSRKAIEGLARVAAAQGDLKEAIRLERQQQLLYKSVRAYPYPALKEAGWLAEAGQQDRAMEIIHEVDRERQLAIPALLYHGVSKIDRTEGVTLTNFKAQMKAIKKAGYTPITASQLAAYYTQKAALPKKPILITFDDGRTDAFQAADPVLAELGFKATMFLHMSGLKRFPFHASMEEVKHYNSTGRWEIQSHSNKGHEPIQVDGLGRTGKFFVNRKYLPEQDRLETAEEFRERVAADYQEGRDALQAEFPRQRIIAFAYPFGEYGQIGAVNIPEAMEFNQKVVSKEFQIAFIQDLSGFNTPQTDVHHLNRLEVPANMTAEDLIEHLTMQEPWTKAKMLEAKILTWSGRPVRALGVIKELESAGINSNELTAQKGQARERMGQPYEARKLYAQATANEPGQDRYRRLYEESARKTNAKVTTEFESFQDNATRTNSKAMMRLQSPVRAVQLLAGFGRATYAEEGVSKYTGNEGSVGLKFLPIPLVSFDLGVTRRDLQGAKNQGFSAYRGAVDLKVLPDVKLGLERESSNLESARAIDAGIKSDRDSVRVDWESTHFSAAISGDKIKYSDGNDQQNYRFDLTRRLTNVVALGYQFWYGDSDHLSADYWTPRKLRQHMGFLTLRQTLGETLRGQVQLGQGHGYQAVNSRTVQSIAGRLEWRAAKNITVTNNLIYSRSPSYSTRLFDVGVGFAF